MPSLPKYLSIILLSLLAACAEKGDIGRKDPAAPPKNTKSPILRPSASTDCTTIKRLGNDGPFLDPSTTPKDCGQLNGAYSYMKSLDVRAKEGNYYQKIFRSTTADGPIRFLNDRVHVIFPQYAPITQTTSEGSEKWEGGTGGTVAVNIGFLFWLLKHEDSSRSYKASGIPLDVSSPYVGYIQLGEIFTKTSRIFQASTLVHEARHSDCEAEDSPICGLPHGVCPDEHPLHGQTACDIDGIGPYFTEAVYMKAVSETCTSCTEEDKQAALITSAESLSRVVNLDDIKSGKENRFSLRRMRGYDVASLRAKGEAFYAKRKRGGR